ncbi:MAG: hypothetical protein AB1726_16335 [Planctomycetota bacterium]
MKRVLLFLLLLAAAFVVLRLVEGPGPAPPAPPPPAEGPAAGTEPPGLSLAGRFRTRFFDPVLHEATLVVESEDSRSLPAADELVGVTVQEFDARSRERRAEIRAAVARLRRLTAPAEFPPRFEERVELADLRATLFSGGPLVPLVLETATAELDARDPAARSLRSAAPVQIECPGLAAAGQGFDLLFDEGRVTLRAEGRVDFARGDATPVHLGSAGPLELGRRVEADPEALRVVVDARDAAVLEFRGAEPSTLLAHHIRVFGRDAGGTESVFLLERLEADGEVEWTAGETHARGEHAVLRFDARGELESWSLEGTPSLRLSLAVLESVELAPEVSPRAADTVLISGKGPLSGQAGGVRRFDMAGPARLAGPGVVLLAGGSVHGSVARDENSADFLARGGVRLDAGGETPAADDDQSLETTELTVRVSRDEKGGTMHHVAARGGAALEGRTADGQPFSLTSTDEIAARFALAPAGDDERAGRRTWYVERASGVVLTVEGPRGFTARADEVTDFDPDAASLSAQGNVGVESAAGAGAGERLVLAGRDDLSLEGTERAPAWFAGPGGRATARTVARRRTETAGEERDHLEAHGAVTADFHRADDPARGYAGFAVQCEALVIDGRESTDPTTGEVRREAHVDARTRVDATVDWSGERTRVRCDTLTGVRRERWEGAAAEARLLGGDTTLVADGHVLSHLTYAGNDLDLDCRHLEVDEHTGGEGPDDYRATASGDVRFDLLLRVAEDGAGEAAAPESRVALSGEGERLTVDESMSGILEPLAGDRVLVIGHLSAEDAPFELTAARFEYAGAEESTAELPELTLWRLGDAAAEAPRETVGLRATALRLTATREELRLAGDVNAQAWTREGAPWSLAADAATLRGVAAARAADAQIDAFEAHGGVVFTLGVPGRPLAEEVIAEARGDHLTADSIWGTLRLAGEPARIASPAYVSEAAWIEFDPAEKTILATGPGRLVSGGTTGLPGAPAWELEYLSFLTRFTPDEILYIVHEPRFHYPGTRAALHSSWALFWIDRRRWAALPALLTGDSAAPAAPLVDEVAPIPVYPEGSPMAKLIDFLRDRRIEGLVREVYLEGPVEMLEADDLRATASLVYFDAVAGHGWIVDARFKLTGRAVGQDFEQLIVRADWLRHSEDGSLRANRATISTSPYDVPGVRLVTGDLAVLPIPGTEREHEVLLRDNRISFYDRVTLPLPPIRFRTDEGYRPLWQSLRVADSARFGTLVSAGITRPAGRVGKTINRVLGGNPLDYDANWRLDGSYLGSRGVLLDLGLDVESKSDYGLDMRLGFVPDSGEDRGYIRVDEDERDSLRRWFRLGGRLEIDKGEWVDLTVSEQSDPGVQSEFWEGEFERYERDESYAQWRKARGEDYFDVTLKARTDEFRSDVEELPSAGAYLGRAPLARLGPLTLFHVGELRAAYLYRRAGEPGLQSPFSTLPALGAAGGFADGFGDRDVLRFDTDQRLESPFALGVAGLRATPFAATRFTAWSEGQEPSVEPRRFFAEAGLRLATTFWRIGAGDAAHFLSPFVEAAKEVGFERTGRPVTFDATENPVGGDRAAVGLRSQLDVDARGPRLDLEVRGTYASDRRDGGADGWLPLEVFGALRMEPAGVPMHLIHEGRYDLDGGRTAYGWTRLASRLTPDLGVEAAHRVARDEADARLLETASIAGIYRWSEKWEFEASETFSLLHGDALDTGFLLRRYGADVIFELESSFREGEGTSVGISIRPRFGWRAPRIGYIDE